MALKLFLKHLFTSIRRRPLQPIFLTIIIATSVAVSIAAMNSKIFLESEMDIKSQEENGNADICIYPVALSDSRFLFVEDVKEVLPSDVNVVGIYSLPFYCNEKLVGAVATDFDTVSDIFTFDYKEEIIIREEERTSCVIVSEDFCNDFGVNMGDMVTFQLFSYNYAYKICGVSDRKFLNAYDIMLDIRGVVDRLTEDTLFFSTMEDTFYPSSEIYIHTNEYDVDEIKEMLSKNFRTCSIFRLNTASEIVSFFIGILAYVVIMLIYFFALTVIYCCFYVLSEQRMGENALLNAVGISPLKLMSLSSIEMIIYWFIGSVSGVFLSIPMSKLLVDFSNYSFVTYQMNYESVIFAVAFALPASQFGFWLFSLMDRRKKKKTFQTKNNKINGVFCLILLIIAVGGLVASILLSGEKKFFVGVANIIVWLATIFFVGKFLFNKSAMHIGTKKIRNKSFLYGMKNYSKISALSNTSSLLTIFFCTALAIVLLLVTIVDIKQSLDTVTTADYLVANITQDRAQDISSLPEVDNVGFLLYDSAEDENGGSIFISSYSDISTISPFSDVEQLPVGNEMMISRAYAKKHKIKINDEYTFRYGGNNYCGIVKGLTNDNVPMVLIDSEYWGIPKYYMTVEGHGNLYEAVKEATLLDNVIILDASVSTIKVLKQFNAFVFTIYLLLVFIVIYACIGIGDSIVSCYRSRREEFDCYLASGMTKKSLRAMRRYEVVYTLGIGFVLFVLCIGLVYLLLYEVCIARSIDIGVVWRRLWH